MAEHKVYLSGPISSRIPGVDRETLKRRFHSVEKWLGEQQPEWEIVNPLKVTADCGGTCGGERGLSDSSHSWACWMRYDLKAMLECDTIVLLPAWKDSSGAALEASIAMKLHFGIFFMNLTLEGDDWQML